LETYNNKRKPKTTSPPNTQIFNNSGAMGKIDKEKTALFAEHLSEVFCSHNNYQDQEVERD
jgi:hypothetical protein